MKKILMMLALIGFAGTASATALCAGDAAATSKDVKAADTVKFIRTDFKMKCSAKVFLDYDEDNAMAWAASASKGGACFVIGNTNGGAPKQLNDDCSPAKPDYTSATDPKPADKINDAKKLGQS